MKYTLECLHWSWLSQKVLENEVYVSRQAKVTEASARALGRISLSPGLLCHFWISAVPYSTFITIILQFLPVHTVFYSYDRQTKSHMVNALASTKIVEALEALCNNYNEYFYNSEIQNISEIHKWGHKEKK